MCEPVSATTAMYMAFAATAVSAGSVVYQGYQANQQAKYQAKIQENNAITARYQADNAARVGEIEREEIRLKLARLEAQGEVGYASSGVALGEGSPMSWSMDLAEQGARDIEMSAYNTDMRIWGLENEASNYENQADLTKMSGQNAFTSSLLQGASTVAQGTSRAYAWNNTGVKK